MKSDLKFPTFFCIISILNDANDPGIILNILKICWYLYAREKILDMANAFIQVYRMSEISERHS